MILSESEQNIKENLVRIWIPFEGSRYGPVPGIYEHKNKFSNFLTIE
jgi:hypothetical protein